MSDTLAVGKKLVDLCKHGKMKEAVDQLYGPNIVSVEAAAAPGGSARTEGIAAVKGKGDWWEANHEVHKAEVEGPFPNGDRFAVRFKFEVTPKAGPGAGKRMTMDEVGVYTVKDGKVVHEEFFYTM